jgi:predicted nucleic acid-binding protein
MNDKVFFDTNVLVYVVGLRERRTEKAEALLSGGGVVSVQVLNELASIAHCKLGMKWEEIVKMLDAIRVFCPNPAPVTIGIHDAALQIAVRYGYHIYDALIIASALDAGCKTLYSEDLKNGQIIGRRLAIVNPFASVTHQ